MKPEELAEEKWKEQANHRLWNRAKRLARLIEVKAPQVCIEAEISLLVEAALMGYSNTVLQRIGKFATESVRSHYINRLVGQDKDLPDPDPDI